MNGAKTNGPTQDAQNRQTVSGARKFSRTQQTRSLGQALRGVVKVHIEELVLHGFPPGGRYQIGDAVERELSRLLSECNHPQSFARTSSKDSVDAGSIRVGRSACSEDVGTQVANAVFGGLAR